MRKSQAIRRRRLRYAAIGFVIGITIQVLYRLSLGSGFLFGEAVFAGSLGGTVLLFLGERVKGLPTRDDQKWERSKEGVDPLGLNRRD